MDSSCLQKRSGKRKLIPLEAGVLNDTIILIPTGVKNARKLNTNKKKYAIEESLECIEDQRFEIDVLIETQDSTLKFFQKLKNKLDKDKQVKDELKIPKNHMRILREHFGDRTEKILEGFQTNTNKTLSIILKRLKDKVDELQEHKSEMKQHWHLEETELHELKTNWDKTQADEVNSFTGWLRSGSKKPEKPKPISSVKVTHFCLKDWISLHRKE